jgi:CubicO group peptidase (beta-lactamase class C family)
MTSSPSRVAAMTRIALPLGATAALLLGACPQAPPARVLAPPSDTTATLVEATSPAAVRADRLLSGFEALGFSGAIMVEEGGRVVLRKGYGLADRAERLSYTPATVQDMGSITKPITAAAILLLEQRGALSVHDPIIRFFEGVPADKREITLHQLLTHTSGLTGVLGRDADPVGADALLQMALASPLESEPGAEYDYSNVGYSLLGMVIERVSGRGYEEFLRQELLLPLGMRSTGYVHAGWPSASLAYGYRLGELYGRTPEQGWRADGPGWHLRANGGLQTTVGDMHGWLALLRGEGPLSAAQVERWTTGYADEGGGRSFYGYGWEVAELPEVGRLIAHNGGNPAFGADFVWLPDRQLFFYVQGNNALVSAPSLRGEIMRALIDADAVLPPAVQVDRGADPALATARAGRYLAGASTLRALADDVRLISTLEGQEAVDAFLNHTAEERRELAALGPRTAAVMEAAVAAREDALEGLVAEGTGAAARARSLVAFLARPGQVQRATVVGSVRNVPGTRFADRGGSTTFVRMEYPGAQRIVSVLWGESGHYLGAAMGPTTDVPAFVLVPRAGGGYTAVERTAPWRTREVAFEGGCLVTGEMRACPDPARER